MQNKLPSNSKPLEEDEDVIYIKDLEANLEKTIARVTQTLVYTRAALSLTRLRWLHIHI